MSDSTAAQTALDSAMREAARLRKSIKAVANPQIRSAEDRGFAKATALAWFNTHRVQLLKLLDPAVLQAVDACYTVVIAATDRNSTKAKYDTALKDVGRLLSELRTQHLIPAAAKAGPASPLGPPPSFAKLVSDPAMQAALARRWEECNTCVMHGAPLGAVVMMGGLIEALLLARINAEPTPKAVFTAKAAPRDKAGKTLPLNNWMLRNYIEVAHELGWISQSAKDVGEVLRDYRNYIHPYKELSHGVVLSPADAALLWDVAISVSRQLVK
jgi:hypothetical protein